MTRVDLTDLTPLKLYDVIFEQPINSLIKVLSSKNIVEQKIDFSINCWIKKLQFHFTLFFDLPFLQFSPWEFQHSENFIRGVNKRMKYNYMVGHRLDVS